MTGFIAMQREALDHPVIGEGDRFRAWFWLVANAVWKPTRTRIKGSVVTLERGEMTYSVRYLADAWGWSKSRVDRFLAELRDEGMIETRSKIGTGSGTAKGQGQSIISICNYGKYQDPQSSAEAPVGQPAGQQRDNSGTTAGQIRTREQGNKGTIAVEPSGSTARRRSPETPLNGDWEPRLSDRSRQIVDRWPPGMFERQLERFRNHAADKDRRSRDWNAAFRNWIIKAEEMRTSHGNRSHPQQSAQHPGNPYVAATLERKARRAAQEPGQPDHWPEDGHRAPQLADRSTGTGDGYD